MPYCIRVVFRALTLLFFCLSFAQQRAPQQSPAASKAPAPKRAASADKATEAPKVSDEQRLALQLLETSEAASRGFEPPMRSYSLLQVGSSLGTVDAPKARGLLRESFTASLAIRDDDDAKAGLQQEIFRAFLPLSQPDVEELLPQAETKVRNPISELIVSRYAEKKQFDRALELITQISAVDEFPYGCASKLMEAMPGEMITEKQNLFSQAVASYKSHEHPGVLVGPGTLTGLIVRFGATMPPKLALVAIDEILGQSKASADQKQQNSIRIGGPAGMASFASAYEFQAFALLPLLQKLDESRAKQLLEENQELQAKLNQYPDGLNSLMPPPPRAPGKDAAPGPQNATTMRVNVDSRSGQTGGSRPASSGLTAQDYVRQDAQQRMQDIAKEAETDPTQAIAHSATLPLKLDDGLMMASPRASALEAIARANVKKNPGGAADALKELRKIVVDLPPRNQAQYLSSAGDLYLQMDDKDTADTLIREGFKVAEKLLETDTNANDPNTALKAWWPSTDAYRRFVEVATKISPRGAMTVLMDIKDPEIRTTESIMVARSLLGLPMKRFTVAEKRKGTNTLASFDTN